MSNRNSVGDMSLAKEAERVFEDPKTFMEISLAELNEAVSSGLEASLAWLVKFVEQARKMDEAEMLACYEIALPAVRISYEHFLANNFENEPQEAIRFARSLFVGNISRMQQGKKFMGYTGIFFDRYRKERESARHVVDVQSCQIT
ncbi:MAG: hypothetical protein GC137_01000 [Alphaproteobacteria bacterium]|nr:hypothetical protein [Alphaproteobacteria bacterium]